MKFGLKINTEFPMKTNDTLCDHISLMFFRGFLIKKTNHTVFNERAHSNEHHC
jgi:hypothetical protein